MKKYSALFIIAIMAMVFCVNAEAAPDKTSSVSASVTITGTTSMSVAPGSIAFGSFSTDAFPTTPADGKIVITYNTNYSPWKINVYTNNTQVPNYNPADGTGRYAKGGLATADGVNVIPCKWVAKEGSNTTVPAVPSFTSLHNFIKDIRDQDDTSTAAYDESWIGAGGYPVIAYGTGPGAQGQCVDPTNNTPGPTQYQGDAVNGSIAVYVAGLFGTGYSGAGSYSSNIYFDLYHE